jgi:2-polyprenyl-3-methyl-5-hydroxy-6-metoxy-1,4-benzoquinol methylase
VSDILIADFETDSVIGGGGDEWNLDWGSELIHKHLIRHACPGKRVLDVCCGTGRASNPFGLMGAFVCGVDIDDSGLIFLEATADSFGYPYQTIRADAKLLRSLFVTQKFDFVLLLDALVHQKKSDAFAIIDQAIELLDDGGRIYVDGPSTSNYQYQAMKSRNECVDSDTFMELCGCTGVMQFDPFCFFHPGELSMFLTTRGMTVEQNYADWFEFQTTKTVCIARK